MRGFLILNAGSSSLKLALCATDQDDPLILAEVDRIGPEAAARATDSAGRTIPIPAGDLSTHAAGLQILIAAMHQAVPDIDIFAVGHRVVHGGRKYTQAVLIDDAVMDDLVALEPLAPLHQPHNLAGIRLSQTAFPAAIQVACFDTAFHRGHAFENEVYALPLRYYDQGIRRYGFHGISYEYVSNELRASTPALAQGRVIIAHLGNGASMCGLRAGRSVASSMGFSTLDGLPMGTRCGQLDPGVLLHMLEHERLSIGQLRQMLYNESGLLGLSGGLSSDMRTLESSFSEHAARAIDYFVTRAQREIASLTAALGGLNGLVFCAGIGEHSGLIRQRICEGLAWMGIAIDSVLNTRHARVISPDGAPVTVMIIPTREDRVIAQAVRRIGTEHGFC